MDRLVYRLVMCPYHIYCMLFNLVIDVVFVCVELQVYKYWVPDSWNLFNHI